MTRAKNTLPKTYCGTTFFNGSGMRRIIISETSMEKARMALAEFNIQVADHTMRDQWKQIVTPGEVRLTQRNIGRPFVQKDGTESGRTESYEEIPAPMEMPPPEAGFKPYWELNISIDGNSLHTRKLNGLVTEQKANEILLGWAHTNPMIDGRLTVKLSRVIMETNC